jgi:uncharacterized protein (DUF1501 family)
MNPSPTHSIHPQVTRRFFLKSTGAVAAYVGVAGAVPAATLARAQPQPVRKHRTLVVLFLRGGADGLNMIVPHADPGYAPLRRTIHVPRPGSPGGAVDLDGFFGLNPRMAALKPLFDSGLMRAAHAVGYDRNTRSHFEEQDTWETGVVGNTIHSDGWLNRHLATSTGHGPVRAVSVGDSLPRILQGRQAAFAVRGLEDLTLPRTARAVDPETVRAALETAYAGHAQAPATDQRSSAADLLAQTADVTLDGVKQLSAVSARPYSPAADYPRTDLARKLAQVARLIKSDVGLEVAEVSLGGWDTHQNQGRAGEGPFGNLCQQVAEALTAFAKDLGDRLDDTLVVTMTDFGRTAAENGTSGTDHGWANAMLLMGGPVARAVASDPRRVVASWPGLLPDQLHQRRDLLHTTDFRDVIAELVSVHLGNDQLPTVLPGRHFSRVGLIA